MIFNIVSFLKKRNKYLVLFIVIIATSAVFIPRYLTYTDIPIHSDVIILLVGPDFEGRQREAYKLVSDGYSRYLYVPYYGKLLKVSDNGTLVTVLEEDLFQTRASDIQGDDHHREYYEETHLEILCAKDIMDKFSFKSANLVSSPYHIRRVKIISKRIYSEEKYELSFISSRFIQIKRNSWWMDKNELEWVVKEYTKIIWFVLYETFSE